MLSSGVPGHHGAPRAENQQGFVDDSYSIGDAGLGADKGPCHIKGLRMLMPVAYGVLEGVDFSGRPQMKVLSTSLAFAAGLFAMTAQANTQTFNALWSGWYAHNGQHDDWNTFYSVGGGGDGLTRNNFFLFDLSGLGGTATDATLRIYNPGVAPSPGVRFGYTSADASETYRLFDVSTPDLELASTHGAGSVSGQTIFADLGSGTSYGEYQATLADNGHFVEINLNPAGLAAINGGQPIFMVGGTVTTLDNLVNPESVFAAGNLFLGSVQLVVSSVPEPEQAVLLLSGLALVAGAARRKAKRA